MTTPHHPPTPLPTPPTPGSLRWTADEAARLRERGALRGKAWSLTQVCEHLALTITGTVDAPADTRLDPRTDGGPAWWTQLGALQRLKRRVMMRALLTTGYFPQGVPSPAFVLPPGTADLNAAIASLRAAAEAFDRKLAAPHASWVSHPLFGPMTGPQWRRFHSVHARHHFKFMKRAG